MFKEGDICELKDGVRDVFTRDGKGVRLFPSRFVVGYKDLMKGVIIGHRAGVKVEIAAELSAYYDATGSVGEYPEEKIEEHLDKIRSRWINRLGDRIPRDAEVRVHIDQMNAALNELIPPELGTYQLRFRGVYLDDMKREPWTAFEWMPPTLEPPKQRSQSREDHPNRNEEVDHEAGPEAGPETGQPEPGPEAGGPGQGPEDEGDKPEAGHTGARDHQAEDQAVRETEGAQRPGREATGRETGPTVLSEEIRPDNHGK